MANRLTDKQRAFIEEYLVDLNATQAAVRAGYSEKTARQMGSENLSKPDIQAVIAEEQLKRSTRTEITADKVLKELALLGFANMEDYIRIGTNGDPYIDLSELTREQAAAISEVAVDDYVDGRGKDAREVKKVRLKFHDKKGALVEIGKHLGMFVERHELTGKDGGPIEHEDLSGMTNEQLSERLRIIRGNSADRTDNPAE